MFYVMKEMKEGGKGGLAKPYPTKQAAIDVAKTQASENSTTTYLILGTVAVIKMPPPAPVEVQVHEVKYPAAVAAGHG